ncbi:DUF2345 domain-containing protein, partial [Acinetobacter sp. YH12045]|uniref:DUF2345 domain-containing protein n=1 Tax=Acinetobacter sp. YH12045 TaxID=2601051 RepID=UPI0015D1016E
THPQQQAAAMHLDAQAAKEQIEANLNSSKALSEVAKNQQTDPLEVLDNLKNFLGQIEKGSKEKADAFKQALMILSAPNSIAVSSQEDIHLSADGQISQSAGDSINLSSQKSLIAHAQSKISLFAAQEGLRAYAGKGKVEIQAQGDGADLIARKGIQIISTEDKVEIKASKKIVLVAGGSQIEISSAGVLPTTSGKFEVKAGQHKFVGGQSSQNNLFTLPNLTNFTLKKKIKKIYWSYGENENRIGESSRFYTDVNLHIETENYADGETVTVKVKNPVYEKISNQNEFLEFQATIKNGAAKIKNILKNEKSLILNEELL